MIAKSICLLYFFLPNLVQAVEQVAEAGPLQGWSRVEGMKAGSERVVALLQNGFQQGQGLGEVALRVVVQLGQAVVHAFGQDLFQEAASLPHAFCQFARLLHHSFGAGWISKERIL